jgi:hypothetical protein
MGFSPFPPNSVILSDPELAEGESKDLRLSALVLSEGARLYRLRKNSRFCLSEGAVGFSPLNKTNGFNGL